MVQNKAHTRRKMFILGISMILYYIFVISISEDINVNYAMFVSIELSVILFPILLMWLVVFGFIKQCERRMYILYQYTITIVMLFLCISDIFILVNGWKEKLWSALEWQLGLCYVSSFLLVLGVTINQVVHYLVIVATEEDLEETEEER
ncbi:MAG: hypothetical protein IKY23_12510 [Lachnospiraceae bacterium]|nr:hypothetical protein [Lachnospiraceae bacterium]